MTLGNKYVYNDQTNYLASFRIKQLEHFDSNDVKEIFAFVNSNNVKIKIIDKIIYVTFMRLACLSQ